MLGGTIVHGEGIGKQLGYPTANIECAEDDIRLGPGVYAAIATLNATKYIAALVIMKHPIKVETHLIDYRGPDIYGEYLEIEPVQRVSTLERYETTAELQEKIGSDIRLVQQVFDDTSPERDGH